MIDIILKEPSLKDVDIVLKCKKYPEFRKELQQIEKEYSLDHNMSIYLNLAKEEESKYFEFMKRDKLYVNFYGHRMSQLSDDQLIKVYYLWIMKMDDQIRNNINRKYTLIYYHSMSSLAPFVLIRDSYKKLPIQYYALLDKIYVVQPNFLLKNAGMFQFGRLYKLYSRRLQYVQNIKELSKIDEIKKNQIVQALPEVLSLEQTQSDKKKQNQKRKQFYYEQQKKMQPKKQQKKDCLTIRLSRHKFDKNWSLPIHLLTLIQTMRKYPQMMELEGIFRKSGSIQQQQQIIVQLSKMDSVGVIRNAESEPFCGYAVAGVIKKLFTKLSDPVVPYSTYNKIMALQGIKQEEEVNLVRDIIYSLPQLNRKTLLYVVHFIRSQVLIHQNNKMNFYNMSVVFSPCFFRPEISSLQDLLNSGRFASIVNILFKKYDQIIEKQENKPIYGAQKQKRGSRSSKGNSSLQPLNTNLP